MQIINENLNTTQHSKRQTVVTCMENMNYNDNGARLFHHDYPTFSNFTNAILYTKLSSILPYT